MKKRKPAFLILLFGLFIVACASEEEKKPIKDKINHKVAFRWNLDSARTIQYNFWQKYVKEDKLASYRPITTKIIEAKLKVHVYGDSTNIEISDLVVYDLSRYNDDEPYDTSVTEMSGKKIIRGLYPNGNIADHDKPFLIEMLFALPKDTLKVGGISKSRENMLFKTDVAMSTAFGYSSFKFTGYHDYEGKNLAVVHNGFVLNDIQFPSMENTTEDFHNFGDINTYYNKEEKRFEAILLTRELMFYYRSGAPDADEVVERDYKEFDTLNLMFDTVLPLQKPILKEE